MSKVPTEQDGSSPRADQTGVSRRWVLGSRDFTLLTCNRFLVTFATQVQAVAIGWLVYELMKDPLYLGLIGLAEAAPALGLALFAGYIVDRSAPRPVYQRAIACSALSAFMLLVLAGEFVTLPRDGLLLGLFLAAFLTGLARSFISPSQFALLPLTVKRSDLGQATAWNSSLNEVAALSGPACGGFLFAVGGGRLTFGLIVLLLILAYVAAAPIARNVAPLPKMPASAAGFTMQGFFSGVHFVFSHQIVLAALALDMFAVLFGGVTALLPIFAGDIFGKGPWGLGVLRAALPVGAFVMGWVLIKVPIARFSGRIMLLAFVGFGLSMLGFGVSTSFYLSLALLFVAGMCDAVSVVTRHTILQLTTPSEMRGRVAAVSAIFIGSSNELGAFESGLAAKLLGVRPSVVAGGCVTLLVVAIIWVVAPQLRKVHLSQL